jgi:hypothetical protein
MMDSRQLTMQLCLDDAVTDFSSLGGVFTGVATTGARITSWQQSLRQLAGQDRPGSNHGPSANS